MRSAPGDRNTGRSFSSTQGLIATGITVLLIFPYNREMEAGITDPERLAYVLDRWMSLNWLRISFWTIPWLALMAYFGVHLYQHKESIRGR
jgi:hypothetical protein